MEKRVDMTPFEGIDLRELAEKYPACVLPPVLQLVGEEALSGEGRRELATAINVRIGDPDTLVSLLGDDADSSPFYPDPRSAGHTTDETIDAFIGKFSAQDPRKEAEALEQLIFRPAGDYAATLLAGEGAPQQPAQSAPAAAVPPETVPETPAAGTGTAVPEQPPVTPDAPHEAPGLSEGFARIMIKNHNYSKALEIIQAISLNNSEKSAYFADQIRFLRKLVLNQSKQKQ